MFNFIRRYKIRAIKNKYTYISIAHKLLNIIGYFSLHMNARTTDVIYIAFKVSCVFQTFLELCVIGFSGSFFFGCGNTNHNIENQFDEYTHGHHLGSHLFLRTKKL